MGLTAGQFPNPGLRYAKTEEKPPFMTRTEIERQVQANGSEDVVWDCLYLEAVEIAELLAYVHEHAAYPWLHPMFCLAAHTSSISLHR